MDVAQTQAWRGYAPIVVRLGMSAVFLWFGVSQVFSAEEFMGYLPSFLLLSGYAKHAIIANGVLEIVLGGLLAAGLFVRPAALLLSLHLLSIIITLGYNDIAVRDAGLLLMTVSIFLGGNDKWCLDYKKNR